MTETLPLHDREILRRRAARRVDLAHDPVNAERRAAWLKHDAGSGGRTMILAEFDGVGDAARPLPDTLLECTDPWARAVERSFLRDDYLFNVLRDDHVIEPWFDFSWGVQTSDYGVQAVVHNGDNAAYLGARRWDPPITDLDRDFDKLHPRTFTVHRAGVLAEKTRLEDLFGDLLPVRFRCGYYWTMGLTIVAIDLIGLEQLMLYMFDNPAGLHRLMAFLRDDHLAFMQWLEREGLYSLNNENDYIGSGSMGYSRALPAADWRPGQPVRTKDLWVLCESQETVGVGPDQFEEFIFPYQLDLVSRFGRCYYGCCEPVNNRMQILQRLPNLARISVSPWADEARMAELCGTRIVYSRKPNPTQISTAVFDEDAIRAGLRRTLDTARGCRVELIMKDVHTLHEQPARLPRWVQLARECCARRNV